MVQLSHLYILLLFSHSVMSNSCDFINCSTSGFPVCLSWSLLKLTSIDLVMPSNHLILCHSLLFLPSIFPSIKVFSNGLPLCIRWPKYWTFNFSISPSNEYWYSHPFKNFPQCIVFHRVKGFSVVNEAEVDVFLELPCFLYDPTNAGNLISGSSAFTKSSLYIWKFSIHVLLKPSLKDFESNLASM